MSIYFNKHEYSQANILHKLCLSLDKSKLDKIISLYHSIFSDQDDNLKALNLYKPLGEFYEISENYDEAISVFEAGYNIIKQKTLLLNDDEILLLLNLSLLYVLNQDFDKTSHIINFILLNLNNYSNYNIETNNIKVANRIINLIIGDICYLKQDYINAKIHYLKNYSETIIQNKSIHDLWINEASFNSLNILEDNSEEKYYKFASIFNDYNQPTKELTSIFEQFQNTIIYKTISNLLIAIKNKLNNITDDALINNIMLKQILNDGSINKNQDENIILNLHFIIENYNLQELDSNELKKNNYIPIYRNFSPNSKGTLIIDLLPASVIKQGGLPSINPLTKHKISTNDVLNIRIFILMLINYLDSSS